MIRIALIGHGYVGKYIAAELEETCKIFNFIRWEHWDHTTDPRTVENPVDAIINAAGYTGVPNVDACETERQACMQGNVLYPLWLEQVTKQSNTPIVHITSGCVYDGYPEGGYTEEHASDFNFDNGSFYSASKGLFEQAWWNCGYFDKSYLLRIRMPFGPDTDSKNLLTKLRNYPKLIDKRNSISYMPDVAKAAVFFAINTPARGIYNAVNPGGVTTREIARLMGIQADKYWMNDAEFKDITVAPRSNCVLNPDKMQEIFKFRTSLTAIAEAIIGINRLTRQ